MTERTHEELKSLVAAYVLGAVPPEEVRIVRAHILTCDECMAEADDYAGAIDSLALAVEPVAVPHGFSERVMARVADTSPAAATPDERPVQVVQKLAWWKRTPLMAGAAVIVVLLALSVGGLVQARRDLARSEEVLSAVLHTSGVELRGASGAAGEVVPNNGGAVFAVAGLQEAPGSHIYQLWFLRDGEPVSVGTFETTDSVVVMELEESFDGYDAAAVTIEPAGGSRLPTTEPVIASS